MYTPHLITAVGPEQYVRLAHASGFYEKYGFRYMHTPWFVQQKVDHATKPPFVKPIHHHVGALNHTFHFAASGEQSFLQTQYDRAKNGHPELQGRWQTITPCFRDELEVTELRRIGFMKLELIDWDNVNETNLATIVGHAHELLSEHVECYAVPNDQVSEHGVDIVSTKLGIELGSYGIRHNKIGDYQMSWIYATGLAEPRLSVVIDKEEEYELAQIS